MNKRQLLYDDKRLGSIGACPASGKIDEESDVKKVVRTIIFISTVILVES